MSALTNLFTDVNTGGIVVSVGAGLTVMLLIAGLAAMRSPVRQRAAARMSSIATMDRMYQAPDVDLLQDRRVSGIPLLDSLIRGRSWVDGTREQIGRAGLPLRVGEYLAIRALALMVGFAIGLFIAERTGGDGLARLFFIGLGAGVGWLIPPMVLKLRIQRRKQQIETQLVELCDVMASMLQSGYGYAQALTATAEEVGPPLAPELQRVLDVVRLGGDIDEAMEELNERLDSRDFDMIASAISIQRKSGGNLAEILIGVAETIRGRQSFVREVRALTSRERFSAVIVAGFPLVLIALLTLMSPEMYGRLFTDPIGRIILGVALTMDAIGFFIIKRITRLEV